MALNASVNPPSIDIVIGLEVHVQLATQTKIFCACPTSFGASPNSQVCPVCAGFPGTLPVLNRAVFDLGMRAVLALGGTVSERVKFDRKSYFYPDLPKNYQISQFDQPLGRGGFVEISSPDGARKIRLVRAHLEEDAGKLIHDAVKGVSLVDLNRAGTPLLEIVSEPELKSPDEAHAYLVNLKAILKSIRVSEADMEKGHLRCDANVSVRKSPDDPLGTKVEIKNLNSFKYVRSALAYEITRQSRLLGEGTKIIQETRLWDGTATQVMRSKEEAHDYRYFPDPDLVPFEVDPARIREIESSMPELPKEKKKRFQKDYGLGDYDADLLLSEDFTAVLFQKLAARTKSPKTLANWIGGPILAHLNDRGWTEEAMRIPEDGLLELIAMVDEGVVSLKVAREVLFPEFVATGASPKKIAAEKELSQISDISHIKGVVGAVIEKNPKVVEDYRSGKETALQFLVGQVMRETKGKANPNLASQIIKERLKQ